MPNTRLLRRAVRVVTLAAVLEGLLYSHESAAQCTEPCPAELACEITPDCVPSVCQCVGNGWVCTTDCGGACPPVCSSCDVPCGVEVADVDLRFPNRVEVCVRNESSCPKTLVLTLYLHGPTCAWSTKYLSWNLAPYGFQCLDYLTPCVFEFGYWCVETSLFEGSHACDSREYCRDFCSEPPPPYIRASDGEFCEGTAIGWNPVSGAVGYRVFRATSPSPCQGYLATTYEPEFFDATGQLDRPYYYSVQAFAPCGAATCGNIDAGFRAIQYGDADEDCDVDLDDLRALLDCVTGPVDAIINGCAMFDANEDARVDLKDVRAAQNTFTGQ